jgi:ABC-2 type transport system ATP-binding protein
LLSTHNLAEVEEACARAIIVSKGRVVADGPLDEIRGQTGRVRYVVSIDEQRAEASNKPPAAAQAHEALERLGGVKSVRELPTDEKAHKFELSGANDSDIRAEIFRLVVAKGWTLLELRRDAQSLDAVFRDLTRGDEKLDRGASWSAADEEDEEEDDKAAAGAAASGDDEDEDDDESDDDEEDDEDEEEAKPKGKS